MSSLRTDYRWDPFYRFGWEIPTCDETEEAITSIVGEGVDGFIEKIAHGRSITRNPELEISLSDWLRLRRDPKDKEQKARKRAYDIERQRAVRLQKQRAVEFRQKQQRGLERPQQLQTAYLYSCTWCGRPAPYFISGESFQAHGCAGHANAAYLAGHNVENVC